MQSGYHYLYKCLLLYIVLSFINNKHMINCQKVKTKSKMRYFAINADNNTVESYDGSIVFNETALPQRSELETEDAERAVTCYTCVNVSNNNICNQFAIDRPCKVGNNFCHTLHIMDPQGKSVLVNKKCSNETECTSHSIGCYNIDNQKICISCCDEDYCNKKVPTHEGDAVFQNSRTLRQKYLDTYKEIIAKNRQLMRGGGVSATLLQKPLHNWIILTGSLLCLPFTL